MKPSIHHSNIYSINKKEVSIKKDIAEKLFGHDFVAKLFSYVHSEEIKETKFMKRCKVKLFGTCISCDNCSGISCGLIFIPRNLIRVTKLSSKKITL